MAVQTEQVRELVDFAPEEFLVTSFFLDVNAAEFPDSDHVLKSFDSLEHQANQRREQVSQDLSHDAAESLRADLEKIKAFITDDFQRDDTNGVAIFSCATQDFWEVIQMPTAVKSEVVFAPRPHVTQIATFLSHTKPTAILLTDRENARILTMSGGDVREWADFDDYVPQRSQAGGWSQMRYQRRSDHWAKHHIDKAADLVLRLQQHYPFDWLILGTTEEAKAEVVDDLHPYVKDRVIGAIHVRIDAPVAEIVDQANQVREDAESRRLDDLIQQIQEYAGAGGRGTIGLEDTLGALNEQKIHILCIQEGYTHPGSECLTCGMLMAEQRESCPACNETATKVENIVDSAIQKAFELGSTVEIATEYNKLQQIQQIGSILYY